jgi:flagellar biosynthesis protein FlhA
MSSNADRLRSILDRARAALRASPDTLLAAGMLAVLLVILVPLPPTFVDALLIVNLTASVLVLLTAASIRRPLEFSVFPSLLLVLTFFRLALNIATTRLILGNAAAGESAAGTVVRVFGDFVAGDNPIVGFVVFLVIVVVQFVVVTKGATRVSEVAARFRLDAMPGKQLSVDGDLAAGWIDAETAREKRGAIALEADFYGAMDGASKFVRGDAIAGLVIVAINVIGGVTIGWVYHAMEPREALEIFTKLTIGDGLISQVPALMISVAAALLVTRTDAIEHLGEDMGRQILANERVLFVAAGFLALLTPTGLPVVPLLVGVIFCGTVGWLVRRARLTSATSDDGIDAVLEKLDSPEAEVGIEPERAESDVRSVLRVEPLSIDVGYRLLPLLAASRGSDFLERVSDVRAAIAADLGVIVPPIRVRDSRAVAPTEYSIQIRGNALGRWEVDTFGLLAVERAAGEERGPHVERARGGPRLNGRATFWIGENDDLPAEDAFELLGPIEAMSRHLESVLREHAAEILTREEVSRMIEDLRSHAPSLVADVVPSIVRVSDLHRVLQGLLREGMSVRDLETILETIGSQASGFSGVSAAVEQARRALRRTISTRATSSDGRVHLLTLDPALEEFLLQSLEQVGDEVVLHLEPETSESIADRTSEALSMLRRRRQAPVIVCAPRLRPHLWRLLESRLPDVMILSHDELADEGVIESHGSIGLETSSRASKLKREVLSGR